MKISIKMQGLTSAVFTELNLKKRELLESGKEVIDFSIGTPDLPPSPIIVERIKKEVANNENYVYAINDSEELINAVINWYRNRYNVDLGRDEITSLLGSQSGFAEVALTLLDPGDIVLTPDPGYPVFSIGPIVAGAEIHHIPLLKENKYLMDFDAIDESIAKKAKLIVVSYPNNPTAATAPRSFYVKLVAFAKKYDIIVLHDNAYSELIFDGSFGGSFLSIPGAKDVGIEFNSLSKTYSIPGCRVAFAVGNKEIITALKTIKSHLDYGMFLPLQKAAIEALNCSSSYVEFVRSTYEKRRNLLIGGLNEIGWKVDLTGGTMFVWAHIPPNFVSSMDFTLKLLEKTGVIVVPGISFGVQGEGFVRIALVQNEEAIKKAITKIKESNILTN